MTVKSKQLYEKIQVGGGATGVSHTADPVAKNATLPASNLGNGESMNKIDHIAPGEGEEETSTENNVKTTKDTAGSNKASVGMKPSAASSMKEGIYQVNEAEHILPMKGGQARYGEMMKHAKKMGYNVHHNEHLGDEKSGNSGNPDVTVHYERGDKRDTATPQSIEIHKGGKAHSDKALAAMVKGKASAMREDVAAMLNGEDLSEDFKEKATVIFEAAVTARINEVTEDLEEQYNAALEEEVTAIAEELSGKINQYMDYVVEQWMEENQVAIEHSLKNEITENFISKLKGLFEESYISIPEEQFDVVEALQSEVSEVQERLDRVMEENMSLKGELSESTRAKILASVTEGLADTQAEKLVALAEGVEYDSAEQYRKKLEIVKENYFPAEKTSGKQNLLEEIDEDNAEKPRAVVNDSPVSFYAQAISRTAKK